MIKFQKNSWFLIAVLVLVALILGEIGFLGYQLWSKTSCLPQKEFPTAVPFLPPHPSPSSMASSGAVKPFVQLVFGWLEELSAESLTLTTEDNQRATFSLGEFEIFLFELEERDGAISLFTFLDEDFGERPGAEGVELDEIELGAPAYLVTELTADGLYLGRRLVVIKE